ncbi:YdaS family helix-turn-helix protein [Luteibacter sp. CQ10]|uniref:YdaS family helix-turn-helix protein n=1 Tax=Luteibacter sp. CQ10 TaxID=2805821 RepID=UPI0034A1A14E
MRLTFPDSSNAGLVDASTKQSVLADDPIRTPEKDAFARAIKQLGGIKKGAERKNLSEHYLLEIIYSGNAPDAHDCASVEKACNRAVTCEEMRKDLTWFRDPAGEVVGYAERIDASAHDLDATIAEHVRQKASATSSNGSIDSLFGGQNKNAIQFWQNVALTSWSEEALKGCSDETMGRIANGAENLLSGFERGIASANKIIWAAIQSKWLDMEVIADLNWLLSSIGEYAIELRELKSDMEFHLKERRA